MPLEAQTRLLRVLQEGEYTTVGGRTPIRADVRIIAATHRDLRQLIRQGLFREDLFYRLNVVPIRLPPLRERTEDIPALVRHFFALGATRGPAAQDASTRRRWSGCDAIAGRAMCASWKIWCAAWPRSIRRRSSASTSIEAELAEAPPAGDAGRDPASGEGLAAAVERHIARLFRGAQGRAAGRRALRPGVARDRAAADRS